LNIAQRKLILDPVYVGEGNRGRALIMPRVTGTAVHDDGIGAHYAKKAEKTEHDCKKLLHWKTPAPLKWKANLQALQAAIR
ncbi:MAG: hypothetical protein WBF45_19480, partial [Acidobacteriaceae bacterium]